MEPSGSDQQNSHHFCSTCAEKILARAKKCTHCGSFQDWRKFVDVGNTALALLVALVTVVGSTLPHVLAAARGGGSNIAVALGALEIDRITLVARNDGVLPGVIQFVTLEVERGGSAFVAAALKGVGPTMVSEEASVEILFSTPTDVWKQKYFADDLGGFGSTCVIRVATGEFGGNSKRFDFRRSCAFLFGTPLLDW